MTPYSINCVFQPFLPVANVRGEGMQWGGGGGVD